jgi:glucosamine--fructose-6-phosphate aminotransferase (isomerizing)
MATPMLIEGLKRLEYRGYDSAGVAIMNGTGVETRRAAGKISRLESAIAANPPQGTRGIAHTRWATHGPPTEANAHPHVSQNGKIAVVHNGIIENATALKAGLEARGYVFKSDTDTEVLAHLIEAAYAGSLEAAVIEALSQVDGTYGMAVLSSDEKDTIVAARKGSPLLIGIGEGEFFIASDASAILSQTRHVVYLDDGDVAVVTRDGYKVLDLDATIREKPVTRIEWDLAQIERGGYPHFMLKEIFEQPTTVENTMRAPHPRGRLFEAGRSEHLQGGSAQHRQHHHHGVRHQLALRAHRRNDDRRAVSHSGRSGIRVGVPLPQSDRHAAHVVHCHFAVG